MMRKIFPLRMEESAGYTPQARVFTMIRILKDFNISRLVSRICSFWYKEGGKKKGAIKS